MAIQTWPHDVPSAIMPMSPQGGLRDNRLSFETDSRMPPIERPLTSWTPEVYDIELAPMTIEQFARFQKWYLGDLAKGVNPFRWPHPITGCGMAWKIVKADPPYRVSKVGLIPSGSTRRRVALSFQIMSWPMPHEGS